VGQRQDIILEMLRRHGLEGGLGRVIEYYGSALTHLSAMDRHVIANMGAELGATTTVLPSDLRTREFLRSVGREDDWRPITAEPDADYDVHDEIDLSSLQPLIAEPSSPGNVVAVREVAGAEIYQAYIGSSANPGFRDFAIAATMVRDREVHNRVSFDINPSSRQTLQALIAAGHFTDLIRAGARSHQPGCNGCIGMGQAPAAGRISLRTVPRDFPGRSGTREDSIYLCSPETAAASALTGVITDPRDAGLIYHPIAEPAQLPVNEMMFMAPIDTDEARATRLERHPTSPHCQPSMRSHRTWPQPCCSKRVLTSPPTTSPRQVPGSCPTGPTSPRFPNSPSKASTTPTRRARHTIATSAAATPSSAAPTTARAQAEKTPRSSHATSAPKSSSPKALPASTGKTSSISGYYP
jgi:hypothetical protein